MDFISWKLVLFFYFLLQQLTYDVVVSASFSLPSAQKQALYELYHETNGVNWKWKLPLVLYGSVWNFSEPNYNPCNGWQGITCTSNCKFSTCVITKLDLVGYDLEGIIPASLSDLNNLTSFALVSNRRLSGHIPSQLQSLSELTIFSLANNNLTGSIPTNLFTNMRQLEYLYLSQNRLHGSFPASIGNAVRLKELFLYVNDLDGSIPASIGNLTSLQALNLTHNYLTGSLPASLANCKSLQDVRANYNHFHGPIPEQMGKFENLSVVQLSTNQLTGTLPSFANAYQLSDLQVTQNYIMGGISGDAFLLPNLHAYLIDENLLTGTIPSTLGEAISLYSFVLTNNMFNGTIPQNLENLPNLGIFKIDNNFFSGTLPSSMQNWKQLSQIFLQTNFFRGTLPEWIGNWKNLSQLIIFGTELSGTVPQSLASLTMIEKIFLEENRLNGTLPPNLNALTNLRQLDLQGNEITGTLPAELCLLLQLQQLLLNNNKINGSIPSCIGNLKHLISLQIYNNLLTGRIPNSICSLDGITSIELQNNFLTHEIPANITSLKALLSLSLYNNHLTGSIPPNIVEMIALDELIVAYNLLSGTLPEHLPAFMSKISVRGNSFHGTLPRFWWNETSHVLDVAFNELEADLSGIFEMVLLPQRIFVNSNQFHGYLMGQVIDTKVSTSFSPLSPLVILNASRNFLSGPWSPSFEKFRALNQLLAADNYMTGSLPYGIFSKMSLLNSLDVGNNFLTGRLPSVFINSTASYFILNLNSNSFTGSIPIELFTAQRLQSVLLSINCLSGTLPEEICQNEGLIELLMDGLHAAKTCHVDKFTGTSVSMNIFQSASQVRGSIPSCIWTMPSLQTLHLSGNSLQGSIAISNENRSTPFTSRPFSSLAILDLSHNRLSGTIPDALWMHNFSSLDLSFNRLGGTISTVVSSEYQHHNQSIMSLEVNRLSGSIPDQLLNVYHINILEGNLFGCAFQQRTHALPKHDPIYDSYQCGSEYTDISLIAFGLIFVCTVFGVCLIIHLFGHSASESNWWNQRLSNLNWWLRYKHWMSVFAPKETICVKDWSVAILVMMRSVLSRWMQNIGIFAAYVLFLGLPLYVLLSSFYGTYHSQYMWTVSPSFLSGMVPAVVIFVFFVGLIAILIQMEPSNHDSPLPVPGADGDNKQDYYSHSKVESEIHSASQEQNIQTVENVPRSVWNIIFIVINTVVVVSVNAAYVVAINQHYIGTALFFVSLALSMFKIMWGGLLNYCYIRILNIPNKSEFTISLIGLTIFNSIIAPYIADMIISPDCFKYAMQAPPQITSTATGIPCYYTEESAYDMVANVEVVVYNDLLTCQAHASFAANVTVLYTMVSTTSIDFTPAFTYNYQCSSSVITSYTYIFIIRYTLDGLLIPLLQMCIKCLVHQYVKQQGANRTSWFVRRLNSLLPPLLQFQYPSFSAASPASNHSPTEANPMHADSSTEVVASTTDGVADNDANEWNAQTLLHLSKVPINPAQTLRIMAARDLAVLLTFGMAFPPLCAIVVFSMAVQMQRTQLIIGRLYRIQEQQLLAGMQSKLREKEEEEVEVEVEELALGDRSYVHEISRLVRTINRCFVNIDQELWQSLYLAASVASVFWAMFLFDILAGGTDSTSMKDNNVAKNIWIFVVTIMTPHALYGAKYAIQVMLVDHWTFLPNTRKSKQLEEASTPPDIEMLPSFVSDVSAIPETVNSSISS